MINAITLGFEDWARYLLQPNQNEGIPQCQQIQILNIDSCAQQTPQTPWIGSIPHSNSNPYFTLQDWHYRSFVSYAFLQNLLD
jgi:hypothetical protein